MERHEILDAMSELKLYGMRASFDEIAGKGLARRDEIYPLIASLIRAERIHRQARSISYRISGAKFPVLKDLDSFVFADTPLDQGQVRELVQIPRQAGHLFQLDRGHRSDLKPATIPI
jgi:hypothetical protein